MRACVRVRVRIHNVLTKSDTECVHTPSVYLSPSSTRRPPPPRARALFDDDDDDGWRAAVEPHTVDARASAVPRVVVTRRRLRRAHPSVRRSCRSIRANDSMRVPVVTSSSALNSRRAACSSMMTTMTTVRTTARGCARGCARVDACDVARGRSSRVRVARAVGTARGGSRSYPTRRARPGRGRGPGTRRDAVGVNNDSSSSSSSSSSSRARGFAASAREGGVEEGETEIWGGQRNASETKTPRRKARTRAEREASAESYEWSAWASSCGVTSIAITATYFRILREVDVNGGVFPVAELVAQLALIAGAAVGMEFYARYAHKHLWHGPWWSMTSKYRREWNRPIWLLHESHHLPREGAFEANDVFALVNGVPAFALCAFGFFNPGVFGGLCFGAGLGITLYGIAYMYVHDGLVHKRFPTGPLGKLPLMRKIAAGHTIHHTEAFEGVPWGLFLGIQELEAVEGGIEELNKVVAAAERKEQRDEEMADKRETVGLVTQGAHIPSEKEAPACKLPDAPA